MNNIKSYIILNKKTNYIIYVFIIVSLIIFISLSFLTQFKYKKYYDVIGQALKIENEFKLVLYIAPEKLEVLKKNNKLIINNNVYSYKINFIDNEYTISNDLNNYLKIILDIRLKEKDKIENNILEVRILESNKKIINYLKEYLRKGV